MDTPNFKRWIVLMQKVPMGPFSEAQIRQALADKKLMHNDVAMELLSEDGSKHTPWKLLWEFHEFDRRRDQPPTTAASAPRPTAETTSAAESARVAASPPAAAAAAAPERRTRVAMHPDEIQRRIQSQLAGDLFEMGVSELSTRQAARNPFAHLTLAPGRNEGLREGLATFARESLLPRARLIVTLVVLASAYGAVRYQPGLVATLKRKLATPAATAVSLIRPEATAPDIAIRNRTARPVPSSPPLTTGIAGLPAARPMERMANAPARRQAAEPARAADPLPLAGRAGVPGTSFPPMPQVPANLPDEYEEYARDPDSRDPDAGTARSRRFARFRDLPPKVEEGSTYEEGE